MPTNLIRRKHQGPAPSKAATGSAPRRAPPAERIAVLEAGRVSVRLRLHDTRTAEVIWRALPLHSIVETWGDSLHFDTPLRVGRERTAKLNVAVGDVCFWTEDERVVLAWGPTPISRPDEVRLMRPCNVWAEAVDDPAALAVITPGEKAVLRQA